MNEVKKSDEKRRLSTVITLEIGIGKASTSLIKCGLTTNRDGYEISNTLKYLIHQPFEPPHLLVFNREEPYYFVLIPLLL